MKIWLYIMSVIAGLASLGAAIMGIICVLLSIHVTSSSKVLQALQRETQLQQVSINNAQRIMQMGNNILQDMVIAAAHDEKLQKLLGDNGYNIQQSQPTSRAAESTTVLQAGKDLR